MKLHTKMLGFIAMFFLLTFSLVSCGSDGGGGGAVTVSAISGDTDEGGTTATFTVVLTSQPLADVTIPIVSLDLTEGAVSDAILSFTNADWGSAQTVTVTGIDDAMIDGDIAFTVEVGDPASADTVYDALTNANTADVSVTNLDDDTASVVVSAISGDTDEGGTTATFTVVLTSQPLADVTIPIVSLDLTEGTVSDAILTFTNADWGSAQTVTVTGVDDAMIDGDIAFTVEVGDPASADIDYDALTNADTADVSVTNLEIETYKFDDGTLQVWTADGLWHVTDVRYSSSPNSVWYADPVSSTYDTGAATSGALTSPLIYLGDSPSLDFDYFLSNQCQSDGNICFADKLTVEVSTDSGYSWTQLADLPEAHAFTINTIDLSAYAYTVVRIRFFFDTFDDTFNAYEGAYVDNVVIRNGEELPAVALFANTSYVDYSIGDSGSEASNLEATLNVMGRSVTTFTGITASDFQTAVNGKDLLAIPELENGDLDADLDAAARTDIADFVSAGGTLIIHADFAIFPNYINLLNSTFGFSLEDINTAGPYDLNTADAFGTIFADGPSTLPQNNLTGSVLTSTLPAGAKVIYDDQTTGDSALTLIPYGDGSIVIFGWDWNDAAPTGSSDGGWLDVLYRAMFANYYLQTDETDRGWWDETGYHTSFSIATVVGYYSSTQYMYNSYFVFDLSGITGDKTGARLRLELQLYTSGDLSETFSVYDVSTDAATLKADDTGQTAIFNDLQTGEVYGTFEVTAGDVGTIIEIPLSAEALSDINTAAGGFFAVGIHLESYSGGGMSDEVVRFSDVGPGTYQLVLTSY